MRIIFMGSGQLACPALRMLLERKADELVAVVTQPDRPSGRHHHVTPCPAKAFLAGRDIRLLTPESVSAPAVVSELAALGPDLVVVADFGQFLKPNVLALPSKGTINIHPSLLPKYRGAAPIQWAIANGDTETGVTIMHVNERLDAGDIILQEKVPIRDSDTSLTLEPLLAELGARLLVSAIEAIRSGRAPRTPQDESLVVLAPKLKKEDGRIDWTQPAGVILNRIRAFIPWPGSFCEAPEASGHFLRVLRARVEAGEGMPGIVLACSEDGPLIACGEQALRLLEVQPEGKKPMLGGAYLNGYKLKVHGELG